MINIKMCTYPQAKISVQHDIEIIKSILLYADKIEIVSPNTTMLLSVCALPYLPEIEKIDFITNIFPIFHKDPKNLKNFELFVSEYKRLAKKQHKSGNDLKEYRMIRKGLDQVWEVLKTGIEDKFNNTGIEELLPLVEKNILTINMIGTNEDDFESDKFTSLLQDNIKDSILSNKYYPLFDENIGNLVSSMAREGMINISQSKKERANHISFTSNILDRLPDFSNQSIDELLDIRKDLNKYLNNFRAAMVNYSSKITDLPWNDDFQNECEKLIISEITPNIDAIEDHVKSNSYLSKLITTFVSEPLTVTPATGLGFLVSKLSDLPSLTNIGMGIAAGASIGLVKSFSNRQHERKNIEKNQLYFYYRAREKVST